MECEYLTGDKLHPEDRRAVLEQYVHRFTGNHVPAWATRLRSDGTAYPLQFANDADWLANTLFAVREDGRLHHGARYCESRPTWPNNPELRS